MKDFIKSLAFLSVPIIVSGAIFQATILRAYVDAKKMEGIKLENVGRSPAVVTYVKGK